MSDKKLKQIKKNWEFRKDVRGHIEGVDVDWLIEQAERVQELDELSKRGWSNVDGISERYVVLQEENARLREAIKAAMKNTHDDDTHEFLNRVLQGKENEAPGYRLKME